MIVEWDLDMQKIIVAVIVLIAAIVVGRRLYKTFRSGGAEGCGCSSCSNCDVQSTCNLEQKQNEEEI
ncbi:MAG: FeoB-associated Cys-rich membrane protein [Desulfovermiculus sp.]|nr:FeoB-associated Cys-rich membrane protein [Desulfovermiculus sp.]